MQHLIIILAFLAGSLNGVLFACLMTASREREEREVMIIGKENESQRQDRAADDEGRSNAEGSGE